MIYFKFSPSCGMLGEKEASRSLISSFFLPFPHFSDRFASFLFIFLQRKKVQQYVQCRASRLKVFFLVISLVLGNQSGYAIVLIAGLHVTS